MKKRSITLIIWLMSIALLGVMAMQYFFLQESYRQKSMIFDETINATLSDVANKLERREVFEFAKQQEELNRKKFEQNQEFQRIKEEILARQLEIQHDINHFRVKNMETVEKHRNEEEELKSTFPNAVAIENWFFETYVRSVNNRNLIDIKIEERINLREMMTETQINVTATKSLQRIPPKDDSVRYIIPENYDNVNQRFRSFRWATLSPKNNQAALLKISSLESELKNLNKSQLATANTLLDTLQLIGGKDNKVLTDVFTSIEMSKRPLKERINPDLALRYLQEELKQKEIFSPFVMQIRSGLQSPSIFQVAYNVDKNDFKNLNSQTTYSTPLFQGDQGNSPGILSVYFPYKKSIITSNMNYMVLPVLALLALLVGCFGYTLSIIFKQKKISEMKTDFINNMTHEFKTPVATIMIASESLRDPEIASNEGRVNKLANIIYDENVRLGSHIERVLNIARLEKENLKIERTEVHMNSLVADVVESMQLQIDKVEGKFEIELQAKNDVVIGDELHLSNVMFNLIDNAIKYSKDNLVLKIRTYNSKNNVIIAVQDNGVGMSKEHQEKIFDQFYRIPTGNIHNVKGFGLGLSYVNNIIKILNGKITVKSEKDKGTQFEVILPLNNF